MTRRSRRKDRAIAAPRVRLGRPDDECAPRRDQEALLDEAIEETFPASDPISPALVRPGHKTPQ